VYCKEKKLIVYCLQQDSPLCHVLLFIVYRRTVHCAMCYCLLSTGGQSTVPCVTIPSIMNICLLSAPTISTLQAVTAVNERQQRDAYEILFTETTNWQIKHTPLYTRMVVPQCACVDASSLHHLMGSSCCKSHTDMASPLWINEKPSVFWEKNPRTVIPRMEQGYLCACACVSVEV